MSNIAEVRGSSESSRRVVEAALKASQHAQKVFELSTQHGLEELRNNIQDTKGIGEVLQMKVEHESQEREIFFTGVEDMIREFREAMSSELSAFGHRLDETVEVGYVEQHHRSQDGQGYYLDRRDQERGADAQLYLIDQHAEREIGQGRYHQQRAGARDVLGSDAENAQFGKGRNDGNESANHLPCLLAKAEKCRRASSETCYRGAPESHQRLLVYRGQATVAHDDHGCGAKSRSR